MRPPSRNRQTFEIKKGYASAFITTDVPPSEWSSKFIDNAFKATGQRPVEPRGRRQVHFTPPQLISQGVSINVVQPEPQVPVMSIQLAANLPVRPRRKSRPQTPVKNSTRLGYQPLPSDPVVPYPIAPVIPTYPVVPPIEELQCPFPCFRSRSRSLSRERRTIYFHDRHEVYFGFTNFSLHSLYYEGKKYHTSEHLYQSFKVCILLQCTHIDRLMIFESLSTSLNWRNTSERALHYLEWP